MPPSKTYSNPQIAQFLKDIATAYIIKKKNQFRITAYQEAAESVINHPKPIHKIWQKDKKLLDDIPGIGPAILNKLDYLFIHHRSHPHIIRAFKNIHPAVFIFTQVNGIGPKIAHQLTQKLQFPQKQQPALEKLVHYAQKGFIRKFPRFGQKSESLILKNTLNFIHQNQRIPLKKAKQVANQIIKHLQAKFPQTEFHLLGSLRRQNQTVGDIDIAAKSRQNRQIIEHLINFPDRKQTISKGTKKASIQTTNNIQVDLMVQPSSNFGSLLQHFTGSRQHNIILRKYAQKLGYSLSEYGIKQIKTQRLHTFTNEKDFYNFLRLCYIEPQKRVGENEVKTAQKCYTKINKH